MSKYLDLLLKAEKDEQNNVYWKTTTPKEFIYKMNEALKAAETNEHPDYLLLKSKWKIRQFKEYVQATRRLDVRELEASIINLSTDVLDVMDAIVKHSSSIPINFPTIYSPSGLEGFLEDYTYECNERGLTVKGRK